LVFEAEPLEADAMHLPPRRPDARLFDTAVLVRGLWQGAGLLALLLGVCAVTRWASQSDDVARAMTFSVLVLSSLGLIFANRRWSPTREWVRGPSNRSFVWVSAAAVSLLAAILAFPAVCRLFAFSTPAPALLLAGVAAAGISLLWFEAVKWQLAGRPRRADGDAPRRPGGTRAL
jgi:Ca2+-transporting ATPase